MPKIFISYRRRDSQGITGRIHDRLAMAFGTSNVFRDISHIPAGSDFRGVIQQAIRDCQVVLVIIGAEWLALQDDTGERRIDNPEDFVRLEVEVALQRGDVHVIPVLVYEAAMPAPDNLPTTIRDLAYRNALRIHDDQDFDNGVNRLIREISVLLNEPLPALPNAPTGAAPGQQSRAYEFQVDPGRGRKLSCRLVVTTTVALLAVVLAAGLLFTPQAQAPPSGRVASAPTTLPEQASEAEEPPAEGGGSGEFEERILVPTPTPGSSDDDQQQVPTVFLELYSIDITATTAPPPAPIGAQDVPTENRDLTTGEGDDLISYGEIVSGVLGADGTSRWRFNAEAGDRITITVNNADFTPTLTLTAPDGSVLTVEIAPDSQTSSELDLTNGGVYTLTIAGESALVGSYTLEITAVQ